MKRGTRRILIEITRFPCGEWKERCGIVNSVGRR